MTFPQSMPPYDIIIALFFPKTSTFSTCSTKNPPNFVHFDESFGVFHPFADTCSLLQNSAALFFYILGKPPFLALFEGTSYNTVEV